MLIEPVEDDPDRAFSDEEKRKLTLNLSGITYQVKVGDCKTHEYTSELIQSWHYQLFNGVREHAGKYRSRDYGEDILTFGRHRSNSRNDVAAELDKHFKKGRDLLRELGEKESRMDRPFFVRDSIQLALHLHALFIKIHPFRDGNGRVGRLIITYVLARHNLPSITFEVPKNEYIDCLNHFYETRCTDIDPLYKLAIRIFKNQLDV